MFVCVFSEKDMEIIFNMWGWNWKFRPHASQKSMSKYTWNWYHKMTFHTRTNPLLTLSTWHSVDYISMYPSSVYFHILAKFAGSFIQCFCIKRMDPLCIHITIRDGVFCELKTSDRIKCDYVICNRYTSYTSREFVVI